MDDDFKFLLPASEVVHVSAVQWLESKKHMPEGEALVKQMRQWESLARQQKNPTKTEAQKIAKEHAIPLGRSIKDLGFLKLLPHIREFWLKRIGDLRSSKSMVPLFSPSKVAATERSRSSRGVAKAPAEGTTGRASGSAEGHGVSTSSGLAPIERSRSPRGLSSVSAAITTRGATMSVSEHGASSSASEHGLHRFFKRKRDDVEHDDPAEPELGPSSSSRVGIVDETGNSMEVRDVKMRLASQTDPVAQVSEVVRNTLIISPGLAAIAVNTTGRRQQSGIELMSRRGALRRRA